MSVHPTAGRSGRAGTGSGLAVRLAGIALAATLCAGGCTVGSGTSTGPSRPQGPTPSTPLAGPGSPGPSSRGPVTSPSSQATIPQPPLGDLNERTRRRLAPESQRVDLAVPSFSNPTEITNPLFPIGELRSAVLVGADAASLAPSPLSHAWMASAAATAQRTSAGARSPSLRWVSRSRSIVGRFYAPPMRPG